MRTEAGLPIHKETGVPYWVYNLHLCRVEEKWRKYQARLQMSELIPELDKILETKLFSNVLTN